MDLNGDRQSTSSRAGERGGFLLLKGNGALFWSSRISSPQP